MPENKQKNLKLKHPLLESLFCRWKAMRIWSVLIAVFIPCLGAEFSKQDSGWIPLFNGMDFNGLYSRMYKKPVTDEPDKIFTVVDSTIHVAPGGGHIGTDGEFSHYRMRVDYMFAKGTPPEANAGLMYHLTEDWPRMHDNWPRSIESQMKKNQTGDAYSIQDVKYDIPVDPGNKSQYKPGSKTFTTSWSKNHRHVYSLSNKGQNPFEEGEWNTMEIIVRGADSAEHTVNGVSLLKLYNIRIPDPKNSGKEIPWGKGKLAVQAEKAEISYRRWEIMRLHPKGPNYKGRLILSSPKNGERLKPGESQPITWKHIGNFSTVNIAYSTDGGSSWKAVQSGVQNSGEYLWKVPEIESPTVHLKLSSEAWVTPVIIKNGIEGQTTGIKASNVFNIKKAAIYVESSYITSIPGHFSEMKVFNPKGKLVRIVPVESQTVRWDGADSKGFAVSRGIYIGQLAGKSGTNRKNVCLLRHE